MFGIPFYKFVFASEVHAQTIVNPIISFTSSGFQFLQDLIHRAIEYGLIIGAVIFLVMLIAGAIQWITSGADRGAIENARGTITQAIMGIVVLIGTFALALLVQDFLGLRLLSFSIYSFTGANIGVVSLLPIGQFSSIASLDIPTILSRLITLGLVIGAIVFIAMLILGGIQWITAGGDKGALESAKQRMVNAVVGLLILFGLWVGLDVLGALLNINLTTISLSGYDRVLTFHLTPTDQFESLGGLTLGNIVRALITMALVIASVVFIIMLLVGGIQYLTSGGDKGALEEARQRITNALIGIFITFCVWVIATLVGYFFGVRLLMFGGIGGAPPGISVTPLPTNAFSPPPTLPGGTPGATGTCEWQGPCPGGFNTLDECIAPAEPICTGNNVCACLAPSPTPGILCTQACINAGMTGGTCSAGVVNPAPEGHAYCLSANPNLPFCDCTVPPTPTLPPGVYVNTTAFCYTTCSLMGMGCVSVGTNAQANNSLKATNNGTCSTAASSCIDNLLAESRTCYDPTTASNRATQFTNCRCAPTPTPQPSTITCSITGPTVVNRGTTYTWTASATSSTGLLNQIIMNVYDVYNGEWLDFANCSFSPRGSATCQRAFDPLGMTVYNWDFTIACSAYESSGNSCAGSSCGPNGTLHVIIPTPTLAPP